VDEHVLAAASRLNEAATALVIVPFHCALIHKIAFQYWMHVWTGARLRGPSGSFDILGKLVGRAPGNQQTNRLSRPAKSR
jgi:hypothetical protein